MRPVPTLRKQAMAALRNWHAEIENMGASTTHPIEVARTFRLEGGRSSDPLPTYTTPNGYSALSQIPARIYANETRPTGRSRIPIKEISAEAQSVHDWMKEIEQVDPLAHEAVMVWLIKPDFDIVAEAIECSRQKAINKFDRALMVIETELWRLTGGRTRG